MNLSLFNTASLFESATDLFRQLNIKLNSNTAEPLPVREVLKTFYKDNDTFNSIEKTFYIGTLDNTVLSATGMFDESYSYKQALQQADKNYEGLMLFALQLSKHPTRTEISELTRAFNRISQKMPVALVLKYQVPTESVISICISERFKYLQHWRQGEKAGKVIILRDIHTQPTTTHTGHLRILQDLVKPVGVTNYAQLHEHWLQVLDVSILNKKFFQELANWYFWATDNVQFPDDIEKKKDVRNATNLIRLITRVIFIWFIKEKKLVPANLFRKDFLSKTVKDFAKNKKSENYYQAILQNLFFGTLNQKMNERKFADTHKGFVKGDQGVRNIYRFPDKFLIDENEVKKLFKDIPFLNGGLFDCLDKTNEETKKEIFVDGFTRDEKHQSSVPDYLFFGDEIEIDLNEIYATKNKKYKAQGLINLLESYKFTVAENTPIEEEIALDPELLGKVFENLLASYNPETQTTARKQTGSFYTPREIVNYMVDESLLEYLKQNCKENLPDLDNRLKDLFSYSENANPFNEKETKILIDAINNCKILDPACGSGAFPMGVLHKMVHILTKLDNGNKLWRELQKQKAIEETDAAYKDDNKEERQKRLLEINDVFDNNASDYGRKLYLIENCIYGIDIQPIAVQIAKLRFFISLVIDQTKQESKENLGIRSLPNLETKFVAANSLISLGKPEQGMFRNANIDAKEKELKDLRHTYFTAKTRKEKIQYQTQDKKLRKEVAKLLEEDGWNTAAAKQIVAFDPYDQNLSASFFENEWMFGLTDGFDIVIGNPPYGIVKSTNTAKEILEKYQGYYSADFKINLFALFLERGLILSNQKGINSFIIPDSSLNLPAFKKLREYILKHSGLKFISHYNENVFENAEVGKSVILQYTKSEKVDSFHFRSFETINQFSENKIELERVTKDADLKFVYKSSESKADALLDKLKAVKTKLSSYCNLYDGINPGSEEIKDTVITKKKIDKDSKKIIDGKCFSKYSPVEWEGYYVYYNEEFVEKLRRKITARGEAFTGRIIKKANFFEHPKIITRQTSDTIIGTIDLESYFVKNSVHSTLIKHEFRNTFSLKMILCILNSKLIDWYYRTESLESGRLFPQVKIDRLSNLPIILPMNKPDQKQIETLVDKIIAAKEKNIDSDTSKLETQLNEQVYKLYELTEEEIKIVEGK